MTLADIAAAIATDATRTNVDTNALTRRRECPCCEGTGELTHVFYDAREYEPSDYVEACPLCRRNLDARRGTGRVGDTAIVYCTRGSWGLIDARVLTPDYVADLVEDGAVWGDDASLFLVLDHLNAIDTREAA